MPLLRRDRLGCTYGGSTHWGPTIPSHCSCTELWRCEHDHPRVAGEGGRPGRSSEVSVKLRNYDSLNPGRPLEYAHQPHREYGGCGGQAIGRLRVFGSNHCRHYSDPMRTGRTQCRSVAGAHGQMGGPWNA
jgi:hypothetical protein